MVECLFIPAFTGVIFSQVENSVELIADLLTVGRSKILLINFREDPPTLVLSTMLLIRWGPGPIYVSVFTGEDHRLLNKRSR